MVILAVSCIVVHSVEPSSRLTAYFETSSDHNFRGIILGTDHLKNVAIIDKHLKTKKRYTNIGNKLLLNTNQTKEKIAFKKMRVPRECVEGRI